MSRDWTREYFGITDDTPVLDIEKEIKTLQEKLDIAVNALKDAATYLTCMDDLSDFNNGKCNEQMALEIINEALEKIKEIK